jgi:hypothetical protein
VRKCEEKHECKSKVERENKNEAKINELITI